MHCTQMNSSLSSLVNTDMAIELELILKLLTGLTTQRILTPFVLHNLRMLLGGN